MASIDKKINRKQNNKGMQFYLIDNQCPVYLFYYGGRRLFYDQEHHDLYYLEQLYAIERGVEIFHEDCPDEEYDMGLIYDLFDHPKTIKVIYEWYCRHKHFCHTKLVFL